jgi:YbbR domain-containing protein
MKDKLKNNLGLKIIAFVFAVFLWWAVVNIDDPINTKQFYVDVAVTNPEVITNAGKSYQILDDTKTITVTIKARRKVLDEIKSSYIMATADLREMQDSSVPIRVKVIGFEGSYESATAYPQNIQVSVENTMKKTFPITTVANGTPRDGYVVGSMTASPKTVDISGPESAVSKISKVVARVDVSEMSSDATIETELVYYDAAENRIDKTLLSSNCDKNGVSVSVDIWNTKKVQLQFDTSDIKPASGYAFTGIEVEPQTIRVAGTTEQLNALTQLEIRAEELKKRDVSANEEVIVDITKHLPEGIIMANSDESSVVVRILVEKAGTKSILLPVGSVQIENAPSKFNLEKGPEQEVELQFSGSKEALEKLSSEKITASVDLSQYTEAGTYTVKVEITELPEGCIYIGEATIKIILTKK